MMGKAKNAPWMVDLEDIYIPDPPCTYCAHARRCRDDHLACYRFARYSGNAVRELGRYRAEPEVPHRAIYDRMFPGDAVIDWPAIPSFLKPQAE